jgi:hypothetical protein
MQSWSIPWKSKRSVIHKQKVGECWLCDIFLRFMPQVFLTPPGMATLQSFVLPYPAQPGFFPKLTSQSCITLCSRFIPLTPYALLYNTWLPRRFSTQCRRQMTSRITLSKTQQDMLHAKICHQNCDYFLVQRSLTAAPSILIPYLAQRKVLYTSPTRITLCTFLYNLPSMAQFWCHTLHWQELQQMVV